MREDERERLVARVLAAAGPGSEAIVRDDELGLTRFAHNTVHQNVVERDTSVRLRLVAGTRTGVATANDLSEDGLRELVARARAALAVAPEDPHAVAPLSHPRAPSPRGAADEATAHTAPDQRARLAAEVFAAAERARLWTAGYVATAREGVTLGNAAGTMQSYDGTTCALNVKANGADATGYAEWYGNAIADLDAESVAQSAVAKALAGARPTAVEPGSWTVVLEPAALGELLAYLTPHFSAQAYDEGWSFLCGGLGRRYAAPTVTIADDYAHPLFAGRQFDDEGVPTRALPLVQAGVGRHLVTDEASARRLAVENTGHATPAPSAEGPQVRHLVVSGGDRPASDLIAGVERGLLITRFWYIRPVDRRRTIVTGMTRDGTFLIEGGEVSRGVRNLRFNQSILDALANAEFAERQTRTGGYAYAAVVPAARIDGFDFSSVADF